MTVHLIGETAQGTQVLILTLDNEDDARAWQETIMAEGYYVSTWLETDEDERPNPLPEATRAFIRKVERQFL
jgi:hypothetical protein